MDATFMNSINSKTSDRHRLLFNLTDQIILNRSDKYVALSSLCFFHTRKTVKKSYKNNKFQESAPTWKREFELPDEPYSILDIRD